MKNFTLTLLALFLSTSVFAQFDSSNCNDSGERFDVCTIEDETLRNLLENNFSATTTCIASTAALESSGVKVPACNDNDFQMLDNTHPTGGIFMGYVRGSNVGFIEQLAQASLNNSVKVNVVVNINDLNSFNESYEGNPQLKALIDSQNVNIIPVNASSGAVQWMQDSMQFATMDGKAGIVQLEQYEEARTPLENRVACQIAKNCNLPIMQTPYSDAKNKPLVGNTTDNGNYRAGGNLEVLPGGVILAGGDGESGQVQLDSTQAAFTSELSSRSGQQRVEIDTGFLQVGHVDEIYNTVKIGDKQRKQMGLPKECNFLILEASPTKARELLSQYNENRAQLPTPNQNEGSQSESDSQSTPGQSKPDVQSIDSFVANVQNCRDLNQDQIMNLNLDTNGGGELPASINQKVIELGCFGLSGLTTEEAVSDLMLTKENIGFKEGQRSFASIQAKNRIKIVDSVKNATGCNNPPVLEVPILVEGGLSILPDAVNGVVATNGSKKDGSQLISPRTFFDPFDNYLESELQKFGVSNTQVQDLTYHINQGEVHCGSNTALICKE